MTLLIGLQVLGGIGLLLYGLEIMKDSLELCTEGRSTKLLERSAKSTPGSIIAGAVVTTVNQKSTATTVMVVGLVNAGMMTLVQAAAVIMGANIGTTVTAQILAFRAEVLAPCVIGVAVVFWKYVHKKRVQYVAEIFIGCGLMFIGMIFIESAMIPLQSMELAVFQFSTLTQLSPFQYVYVILVGFLLTALVRSSSVITGVMIAMSAQQMLSIEVSIPLILGINMGKCLSAIWSSRGATRTAKRAAVIHLLFNTFGAALVVLFFRNMFQDLIVWLSPESLPRQIANAHTFFNLCTAIVCLPFIQILVNASNKLVPAKKVQEKHEVSNLDVRMLETPGIALAQANSELYQMASLACTMYEDAFKAVDKSSEQLVQCVQQQEYNTLRMQKEIEVYLVKLSKKNLSHNHSESLKLLLGVTGDVERISDTSSIMSKLAYFKMKNNIHLSGEAKAELRELQGQISLLAAGILEAVKNEDAAKANSLISMEIKIKNMEETLREKHVERLNSGLCNPGSGVLFLDMISHMERVAGHLGKIGIFVVENSKF